MRTTGRWLAVLGAAVVLAGVYFRNSWPVDAPHPPPQSTQPIPKTAAFETPSVALSQAPAAPAPARVRTVGGEQTSTAPPPDPEPLPDVVASDTTEHARVEAQVTRLTQVLSQDPEPGHRLRAVDELKFLGRQGDSDGRINAALQAATADPDTTVAVVARDAISELLN